MTPEQIRRAEKTLDRYEELRGVLANNLAYNVGITYRMPGVSFDSTIRVDGFQTEDVEMLNAAILTCISNAYKRAGIDCEAPIP